MDYQARLDAVAKHSNAPYIQFLRRMGLLIHVASAEGAIVVDTSGRRFVDCIAGYGNCFLGHKPRAVVDAVAAELRSPQPFNLPFVHEVQARLFERLAEVAPDDLECAYVVNSGSEAVETALKLARLSTKKPGVVCANGAWHGFTYGCLSISEPSMCTQFEPLAQSVKHVAFGSADAVEAAIDAQTGCVIVEPVQAESGAVVPPDGYLCALQEICARRGVLLIFDEVKSGMGKTGAMFACEHDGAVPDVIACGKALGGGVMPIGAVIARRSTWGRFGLSFPMSSSSGATNAPACAAAVATLDMLTSERLVEQARAKGARLRSALEAVAAKHPDVVIGVDGRGLLLSLCFATRDFPLRVIAECARRGVLVMTAFCDRSKLLIEPPVCIGHDDCDAVAATLDDAVAACRSTSSARSES